MMGWNPPRALEAAVEDSFFVVRLIENDSEALPDADALARIHDAFNSIEPNFDLVCDARKMRSRTSWEAVWAASDLIKMGATFLADHSDVNALESMAREIKVALPRILPIRANPHLHYKKVDTFPFENQQISAYDPGAVTKRYHHVLLRPESEDESDYLSRRGHFVKSDMRDWRVADSKFADLSDLKHPALAHLEPEWERKRRGDDLLRRRVIEEWLLEARSHSLLTEFALHVSSNRLTVVPYRGSALYQGEAGESVIVARPSVLASRTGAILQSELAEFDRLLNDSGAKERHFQKFFETHERLIKVLGYSRIVPQVVLQREDEPDLRPDFMVQPIGEEWWDILDLKLPEIPMIVGQPDRKTYSALVHSLVAQLKTYAAAFDDPRVAKRVEQKYGIRAYKPKVVGIIGREVLPRGDREIRRAMTAYTDVEVMTFDRMREILHSRLLI